MRNYNRTTDLKTPVVADNAIFCNRVGRPSHGLSICANGNKYSTGCHLPKIEFLTKHRRHLAKHRRHLAKHRRHLAKHRRHFIILLLLKLQVKAQPVKPDHIQKITVKIIN